MSWRKRFEGGIRGCKPKPQNRSDDCQTPHLISAFGLLPKGGLYRDLLVSRQSGILGFAYLVPYDSYVLTGPGWRSQLGQEPGVRTDDPTSRGLRPFGGFCPPNRPTVHLADALRSGDLYVLGAQSFADYREQLLPLLMIGEKNKQETLHADRSVID